MLQFARCLAHDSWWWFGDVVHMWTCLQCFDTVGWAPGRASSLRCWCGYLSGARCRLFACGPCCCCCCGPTNATAIPKPYSLLRHLYPDWFYLSGTGLSRFSWKRGHELHAVIVVVVVFTCDLQGNKETFESYYRKQRRKQERLALQSPPNMVRSLFSIVAVVR